MKLSFSALFLVLFLSGSLPVFSQPSWEIGTFGGSSGYMGDLNPIKFYKLTDPAYGGFIKRNFDGYWSLKFSVLSGKIRANDSYSKNIQFKNRNLHFFSPITELSIQTEFNFFDYIPSSGKRRFSPYLFTGLGFVSFNPQALYVGDGRTYELNLQNTEDLPNPYNTIVLSIPFGAGVKYNLSGKITLGGEVGYRTAYTDYLDDVSGKYAPGLSGLRLELADPSTPKNIVGSQRGDARKRDTYIFAGLTLSYAIFNQKCPAAY
ncbi:MAG: outer membrane beta-barrel protein [Pyrinomonadaceae bacterium]|nr:outer membrane beta-barrel protein [Sphingobacteriaceae bacterium]